MEQMTNVDTPSTLTHVSLCAGYGGIDLGLKRAIPSLRTIAFAEIEAFACANLVAKMEAGLLDPAPLWTDLKSFPWADFHDCVDILSGGYPCQPFSAAGKRLGADDPRHLWPYISAGIAAMRPSLCFFENVEGHISLGLPDVIEDLAGLGYRTTWGIFSASEVGAVHQRKRVFILAHNQSQRIQGRWAGWFQISPAHAGQALPVRGHHTRRSDVWPSRPGQSQHQWEPPRVVMDDTKSVRSRETADGRRQAAPRFDPSSYENLGEPACELLDGCWPSTQQDRRGELADASQRQIESPLGGDPHGPTGGVGYAELCVTSDNRTDELRLLGNGVVPATAERAFRVLFAELT